MRARRKQGKQDHLREGLLVLLYLLLVTPLGKAVEIVDVQATPFELSFQSTAGSYHLVEASTDLQHWIVVADFEGDGRALSYSEGRPQPGTRQQYRIRTKASPFEDGLLEREWNLIEITEGDAILAPLPGRRHSMQLGRDGRMSGWNDCNRMFGGYTLTGGNQLRFSNIASTQIFCPPGSIDFTFLQQLTRDNGVFEVDGRKLSIYFGSDPVVRFDFEAAN